MRVGILSLIHESNTFAVTPTTIDLFQRDELMIGDEVRRGYEGGHHQISAFLEGLSAAGIEGVPIFHASTPPSACCAGSRGSPASSSSVGAMSTLLISVLLTEPGWMTCGQRATNGVCTPLS